MEGATVRVKQGTLVQENGSWYGKWSKQVFDPATGRSKRKQCFKVIGPTKGMSEKKARLLLRDAITGDAGLTGDGSMTFKSFIQSVWLPLHEGQWRPSSKETILQRLEKIYEHFGGAALTDVDAVALQGWLNDLAKTRSASTVRMAHAYLRSIFKEAVEGDYLRKNPARLLRVPRNLKATARPYLTIEEIGTLLDAAKPFGVPTMEFAVLTMLFVTGLRPSEALALRWSDLDFTEGNSTVLIHQSVYRGKLRPYTKVLEEGEEKRKVLPELAAQTLLHWFSVTHHSKPTDYVFVNSRGGVLTTGNYLHRVLQPLAEQAKIKKSLTFQMVRRSVATHAAELGTLKTVSEILGHKRMQTTQETYIQTIAESVKTAAGRLADKLLTRRPTTVQ
jgi:integrase